MKTIVQFAVIFVLAGCGGPSFTTAVEEAAGAAVVDDSGAGGSTSVGGAPSTGGTGGTSGGAVATGGAPEVDAGATGGVPSATGGAPATGGVVGSGGAPETGGTSGTGGAPLPCDGAGLSTHDNGIGQTWQDCVPVGTYDSKQAMAACKAWCDVRGCVGGCFNSVLCGVEYMIGQTDLQAGAIMTGWAWYAPNTGNVVSVNTAQTVCSAVGSWD